MPARKVLLLGGTGFFGKSFLDSYYSGALEEFGVEEITVVARSARRLERYSPPLGATEVERRETRLRVVEADVSTTTELPTADVVIHAATSVELDSTHRNLTDEAESIAQNARNFAQVMRSSFHDSRICYISSGAVYGDAVTPGVPTSETVQPALEAALACAPPHPLTPKGAYALGKLAAESVMQELRESGFAVSIARAFSFMGRRLLPDHHFALSSFIASAQRGETIRVGRQMPTFRSYMAADDMVRWMMTLATHAHANASFDTGVFNVGSAEAVELGQLARHVGREWGVPVDDILGDTLRDAASPVRDSFESGVDWYVPDTSKARGEFNLDCRTSLDEFLARVREDSREYPSL